MKHTYTVKSAVIEPRQNASFPYNLVWKSSSYSYRSMPFATFMGAWEYARNRLNVPASYISDCTGEAQAMELN